MKTAIGTIVLLALIAFGVYAYSTRDNVTLNLMEKDDTSMTNENTGAENDNLAATSTLATSTDTAAPSSRSFDISGKNFSFNTSTIRVKKGDTVKITFKNEAGSHDFRIDEFKVATAILPAGGTQTVEFVANKAGSFEYYCSVGSHRANGMKGTLVVE